ncbi:MAG: hypothetical protein QG656_109, partial [Candidatus Hydrogenedentes bacterium]|nr:hypothetical protein [Candidatus Hydrogenedentota bacterium]
GLLGSAGAWAAEARPNFVFINIDDLAWNALGFEGRFPFLQTPHIDRLAREGAKFSNAFVTISLCAPSRACSITGCYAHRHGVRTNEGMDPKSDLTTFPQALQRAGYETAHIGKWHMKNVADPRPGFDYWLSFVGQGRYENPELNENGRAFQQDGYMTDILTDYAVAWLKQPREKPFCLDLWHKAVHGPFTPAERHKDAFPGAEFPKPPNFDDTLAGKPAWLRKAMTYGTKKDDWQKAEGKPVPPELPPAEWNASDTGRLDYLRTLLAVDDSVGRVLATLEEIGQLDNTVVVFTSDNGYFLGEHRRGDKRLAYEESIRIPLLMRYPKRVQAGAAIAPMALHIDVPPTILELAGAPIPDSMQGQSLVPLLDGKPVPWREAFLYEYFVEAWQPGLPTIFAVRTERWKYIACPQAQGDIDELYDLENDPIEMHNLALDPAHADMLAAMKAKLDALLKESQYEDAPPPQVNTESALALQYTLAKAENGVVRDESGNGNDGTLNGLETDAEGPRFDGKGSIAVEWRAKDGGPAQRTLTVGGWVTPEAPDGVIFAWGGESQGFSFYLRGGTPEFAVRSAGTSSVVRGQAPVEMNQRVHLAATLAKDRKLRLYVNGKPAGEADSDGYIMNMPNDGPSVGADTGSAVGEYHKPFGWTGRIHDLRLYWGEIEDEALRRWAAQ